MVNIFHDIDPEMVKPESFTVVIEIPKGSKVKYELDKDTGMLRLDRILFTSTHYPASYGFIPRTYADDGDPLDALVLCSETIAPLTLVQCRPIGAIKMVDQGDNDEKVIAVCEGDPDYKDAAYACLEGVTVAAGDNELAVALERPLAKYRIVAKDIDSYRQLDGVPAVSSLTVSVAYEGFFL